MKLFDQALKYNLAHSYHSIEDIFSEVSVNKNPKQKEIYTLMRSRILCNANLIRNYVEPIWKGTELGECKWNLINYLLFTGNTGMLDFVMKNCRVSLIDALKDDGLTGDKIWAIDGYPLSSFGIYACLMKR
jgi:hypothetical protein